MEKGCGRLMLKLTRSIIFIFFILFVAAGCARQHLSKNYGRSYESMLYAQTINLNAPADRTPVDGSTGVIGAKVYENFKKGYGTKSFAEQLGDLILSGQED